MAIFTSSPRLLSSDSPHITSIIGSNSSIKASSSFSSFTISGALGPVYILNSMRFALLTSHPYSNGEFRASRMAFCTRSSPLALPIAIIAPPPAFIVDSTSRKSRFKYPSIVISSDMLFTASHNTLSATLNDSMTVILESEKMSQSRSLLIISSASTFFFISSTPLRAFIIFRSFSK